MCLTLAHILVYHTPILWPYELPAKASIISEVRRNAGTSPLRINQLLWYISVKIATVLTELMTSVLATATPVRAHERTRSFPMLLEKLRLLRLEYLRAIRVYAPYWQFCCSSHMCYTHIIGNTIIDTHNIILNTTDNKTAGDSSVTLIKPLRCQFKWKENVEWFLSVHFLLPC